MPQFNQSTTPLKFPKTGEPYEGVTGNVTLEEGDSLTYSETGTTYTYTLSTNSWTGSLGSSSALELDVAIDWVPGTDFVVGNTVTAASVAVNGTPPYTYVYRWYKDNGVTQELINGSNTDTTFTSGYELTLNEVGSVVYVEVIVTDADGSTATDCTPKYGEFGAPDLVESSGAPPVLTSVNLVESNPGTLPRFTHHLTLVLMVYHSRRKRLMLMLMGLLQPLLLLVKLIM